MIDFNAHFDGKAIVPQEAVDLPRDRSFAVHLETFGGADTAPEISPLSPLQLLTENAFPLSTIIYVYGTRSSFR
jgi:hypothetical protein